LKMLGKNSSEKDGAEQNEGQGLAQRREIKWGRPAKTHKKTLIEKGSEANAKKISRKKTVRNQKTGGGGGCKKKKRAKTGS